MAYRDGTYAGIAQGMSSIIRVTLVIKDGTITTDEIWQDCETQSVGGYEAIKDGVYATMIDAAQGPDIDTISGATITTAAIKAAVARALAQAE
ncbi:MAG: FMN-binding protein [Coriobacteriaceae bacterium]|jgi:uncharacterized protein with FMN-binding domain|nr:FMN-binding protein [Coriobacteriaceae bacterium]